MSAAERIDLEGLRTVERARLLAIGVDDDIDSHRLGIVAVFLNRLPVGIQCFLGFPLRLLREAFPVDRLRVVSGDAVFLQVTTKPIFHFLELFELFVDATDLKGRIIDLALLDGAIFHLLVVHPGPSRALRSRHSSRPAAYALRG